MLVLYKENRFIYIMNTFTESELLDIYNRNIKLNDSYFYKYVNLPVCPVKKWNNSWDNRDFPRVLCVLDFIEWVKKYNIENIDKLAITCTSDPELEFITSTSVKLLEYPEYDLHTFSKKIDEKFDFFIFNQTLEHLYNPFLALQNIYNVINDNGYVFTSVPTLNIPHLMPFHYNGFTPAGLGMLFKSAGFEILEIGQWGNLDYIQKLWSSHTWPDYNNLKNRNGQISNEEQNVCQCWILAKKLSI